MSQSDPTPPATPESAEPDAAVPEPAEPEATAPPLNRADRRAKAKAAAKAAGHAGPAPDRTLRRGRGPRSHTKRI